VQPEAAPRTESSTRTTKASSFGAFANALTEIASDPQTPDEIATKLINLVSRLCETAEPRFHPGSVQKVVRAERFELLGINGNLCAELHSLASPDHPGARTVFSLKGPNDQTVSVMADSRTGELSFQILNHKNDSYPVNLGTDIGAKKASLNPFDQTLLEV
jgi:hypothetical protein